MHDETGVVVESKGMEEDGTSGFIVRFNLFFFFFFFFF